VGGVAVELAWAPVAYDGAARALVHALKLRGLTAAADLMAAQIAAGAPTELLAERTLVPVPGNPRKRRARGFDPAERIARALARRIGLPAGAVLTAQTGAASQVGAGREQRLRRAAIDVAGAAPRRALLVDDVQTTGATLEACAKVLRELGVREVRAVTAARAVMPPH
jgi:predicted amidophosphoribosyltransferase